jgi:hypothetical protein
MGRARGTLRYLGMVTIYLNDYPFLKYVIIGMIALLFFYTTAHLIVACRYHGVICFDEQRRIATLANLVVLSMYEL